jgi:hypothetical protein
MPTAPLATIIPATFRAAVVTPHRAIITACGATLFPSLATITADRAIITTAIITLFAPTVTVITAVTTIWRACASAPSILTTAQGSIGGGGKPRVLSSFREHILSHIMCNNLIINFIQSNIIVTIDGSCDVVVGAVKAVDDVADHLIIWNWLPGGGKLGRKPLHLGEENRGGQLKFLGAAKGAPQLVDLGAGA